MMRLRALRLSEVGRFTTPIAVEGFGDGLNILSGPNELGKSTLLRALEAVLNLASKNTNKDTIALQSNSGGNPVIEADFEAEGHLWRLRKQFLGNKQTLLTDVTTGAQLKNADAEARLAAIKASGHDFDRFGLLWVRQGDFSVPRGMGDGGLGALIASEVEAVALDARAIHEAVRKALEALQTASKERPKPKAHGTWAQAIKANEEAVQRFTAAEVRAGEQSGRLTRLAALVAERNILTEAAAVAARADALSAAEARHKAALDAHQQAREAKKALDDAFKDLGRADRDDKDYRAKLSELADMATADATSQARHDALQRDLGACAADLTSAREALATVTSEVERLDRAIVVAREAIRAGELADERDRLATRIADVRAAQDMHRQAQADVTQLRAATAARVQALRATVGELASIDRALGAVVPEVAFELTPEGAGRITVDGRPLAANATLSPDRPLVIEIAGVGRITVSPNPATVSATARASREQKRAEIETAYAALGVATLPDAEARLGARLAAEACAREAEVRVNALAPQGLDRLIAQHADISAQIGTRAPVGDGPSLAALDKQMAEHRRARDTASARVQTMEKQHAALREQIARLEAADGERALRSATLATQLGDEQQRQEAAAVVAAQLQRARDAYTTAKLAADAWALKSDMAQVDALAAAVTAARHAEKVAEARKIELDQLIHGLERELGVVSDEDVDAELEQAREALAAAASRLADVEGEVKALNLLDREFQAISDAGRRELSGPILKRIQPYLERVLPDALLELGDTFMPAQLVRQGRSETHAQLSRGTQEQIAILVRLGLAHLLAQRGAAVPVILDDALVYADDRRIAQMFAALEDAARLHQVIVLNCRETAYAALASAPGTTVLQLQPWARADSAA